MNTKPCVQYTMVAPECEQDTCGGKYCTLLCTVYTVQCTIQYHPVISQMILLLPLGFVFQHLGFKSSQSGKFIFKNDLHVQYTVNSRHTKYPLVQRVCSVDRRQNITQYSTLSEPQYQRIYISDRTHSTPQRLPKMCPRNLSPPALSDRQVVINK